MTVLFIFINLWYCICWDITCRLVKEQHFFSKLMGLAAGAHGALLRRLVLAVLTPPLPPLTSLFLSLNQAAVQSRHGVHGRTTGDDGGSRHRGLPGKGEPAADLRITTPTRYSMPKTYNTTKTSPSIIFLFIRDNSFPNNTLLIL